MPDFDVDIDGLDELQKALRSTADGLDDAVRAEFLDEAKRIAADARGAVPRRTGAARATVDAQLVDGAAAIVAGGRRAPYFPWLEYGGRVGRNDSVSRPFVKDGRYIGRAVDASISDIEAAALRGAVEAARAAGLEVSGGS